MFGIDSAELLLIAVVALVVIGPKDLPRVMRGVGNFLGQMRGMARHFRSGVDNMMRESELADMEKKWQADNERIMRDHPMQPDMAEPEGREDWPAANEVMGEAWPDPLDAPAKPAPRPRPRQSSRADDNRPKPPPRRARTAPGSGSAPPIPRSTAAKDEGG